MRFMIYIRGETWTALHVANNVFVYSSYVKQITFSTHIYDILLFINEFI